MNTTNASGRGLLNDSVRSKSTRRVSLINLHATKTLITLHLQGSSSLMTRNSEALSLNDRVLMSFVCYSSSSSWLLSVSPVIMVSSKQEAETKYKQHDGEMIEELIETLFKAQREGDLNRLLIPRDSDGFQCGEDSEVVDKKFLMFFDLSKCADPLVPLNGCPTPQTCVKECPSNNFVHDKSTCERDPAAYKKQLICSRHVKLETIGNCNEVEALINGQQCAKWYLKSEPCKLQRWTE